MGRVRVIDVHCAGCRTQLYRYRKERPGHLVKCFIDRITRDFTRGDLKCPECGQEFARHAMIHGKPAHKIIQGKVIVK